MRVIYSNVEYLMHLYSICSLICFFAFSQSDIIVLPKKAEVCETELHLMFSVYPTKLDFFKDNFLYC